jgi:hypothetical protein
VPKQNGSVRAARERLERSRANGLGIENVNNPLASQYSTVRSPTAPVSPSSAYSIPTEAGSQSPQWPLPKLPKTTYSSNSGNSQSFDNYNQRNAPSNSRIPLRTNRNYTSAQDSSYNQPSKGSGATRSSQDSDLSVGSISDFPVPANTSTSFRSANPNPPPQPTRKGISSYYSQYTNVSPIIEESEGRNSARSYASSNVMPTNARNFYFEGDSDEDEAIFEQVEPTLYRNASIGKRGKPLLTSIKSPESNKPPLQVLHQGIEQKEFGSQTASISQESLVKKEMNLPAAAQPSTSQIEVDKYLKDLETDHVAESELSTLKQVRRGTLADRVGSKIPPRINVAAVREAENRASLTSLPDLIRRATKLAANLDRGKTASRLGTEWMMKDTSGYKNDLEKDAMRSRPQLVSPIDRVGPEGGLRSDDHSGVPILTPKRRQRNFGARRCCGMSRKSFIGVMIILILLICAAVVIPVALILVPRGNNTNSANSTCAKKLPCQNGGISMAMSDGTCICLCSSGNSGIMCQATPDMACGTIAISSSNKATVGTEVEPLMLAANANFSIPLDDQALLQDFAKLNMSCAAENALVTFPNVPTPVRALAFAEVNNQGKQESVSTANGILVAPTPTASDTPVITGTPGGESATMVNIAANSTVLQFAKIGILFVLQDSQAIAIASGAQTTLLDFFTAAVKNGTTSLTQVQNVDLGNGYSIDLWDRMITLKNGTIYGNGWNGTATSS